MKKISRVLLTALAAVGVTVACAALAQAQPPVTVQSIPALPLTGATIAAQAATAQAATTTSTATTSTFQASPLAEHPGWRVASACFACHGTDGKDDTFGALNIFSKEDFMARMQELKTTEADNEGLMKPHSAGYTDEQIEQMADYFSQVE